MNYSFASVVLPLLGEQSHDISGLANQYVQAIAGLGLPAELILVVKAADKTIVSQSFPDTPVSVRCIASSEQGWGAAVQAGLRSARGDLLSYTNWLSTRPENLALVLSVALANPDMVVKATRRFDGHWLRKLGGALYTAECRQLFDLPYWDINATPKAFPKRFNKLLDLQSNDFLIETEFCVACRREPYPVLEVPVHFKGRFPQLSIGGWYIDAKLYWKVFQLRGRLSRSS
jgi:hypothetical protein